MGRQCCCAAPRYLGHERRSAYQRPAGSFDQQAAAYLHLSLALPSLRHTLLH